MYITGKLRLSEVSNLLKITQQEFEYRLSGSRTYVLDHPALLTPKQNKTNKQMKTR